MISAFLKCTFFGGALFSILASVAPGSTMLIDFGRTDNQTVGNFNNFHGAGTVLETPSLALIDSTGAATGITLNADFSAGGSFAGAGADFNGPYPAAVSGQASTALADSMFIRSPASSAFSLSGLDAGLTYDIWIYGARGNNGEPNSEWTLTDGAGPQSAAYEVFNNSTNVATFTGLVPDGSNEISLLFTTTDDGSRPRGAMNFMQVTSVPEPSSTAFLLGAFTVACLVRRRN